MLLHQFSGSDQISCLAIPPSTTFLFYLSVLGIGSFLSTGDLRILGLLSAAACLSAILYECLLRRFVQKGFLPVRFGNFILPDGGGKELYSSLVFEWFMILGLNPEISASRSFSLMVDDSSQTYYGLIFRLAFHFAVVPDAMLLRK